MKQAHYKRVLLKISGEALMGHADYGIDKEATIKIAHMIGDLAKAGKEIGIVVGGGNIFRGIQKGPSLGIDRIAADQMGMLATIINGIALQQAITSLGLESRVLSALECPSVAETYQPVKALHYLKKGSILLFVGGTGHPFFTTDTTAALRACEISADIFLKATLHVDGVYNKDPRLNKDAKKYSEITYEEALAEKLGVCDLTAVALCMSNNIPIKVFKIFGGSFLQALTDNNYGTLVKG